MKRTHLVAWAVLYVVSFLVAGPNDYVDFNDGQEHLIDYHVQYSPEVPDCSVRVDNGANNLPGTHLRLIDGARIDWDLLVYNSGSVTVESGARLGNSVSAYNDSSITVNGGDIWQRIYIFDSSHVVCSGGYSSCLELYNNATGEVLGGYRAVDVAVANEATLVVKGGSISNSLYCYTDATILVEGGSVANASVHHRGSMVFNGGTSNVLWSRDRGHATINSGVVRSIVASHETSTDVYGGNVSSVTVGNDATVTLTGDFRYFDHLTGDFSTTSFCGNLADASISQFVEEPFQSYWKGQITGTLQNGESCTIDYTIGRTNPDWTCDITLLPIVNTIAITSPNGGETYTVGTTKTISWESEGKVFDVEISYSTDNGSTWTTIKTVANTGSTTWTIPNTPSAECLVRISDADDPEVFDISDAVFTIQPAYPVLVNPNGGQEFYTGTVRKVYWNTVGSISDILIEYSTDSGSTWTEVDPPNVGNTSPYSWAVPYEVSEQCLVRVSDADNPSSSDVSDAPFGIVPSRPDLWFPNGGENWLTGSEQFIRWGTKGSIENIAIEYSTDNGSTWQSVSPAAEGNLGLYTWTVPHEVSDQCLVRVSDADHPEIYDMSDSAFQIVSSLPHLVSPNGGENLLSGSTVPIEWETTGVINDMRIEYSLDDGASWQEVSPPNTGNTGSYDWIVPYEMSKECLVRVSDQAHPVVNDVSDAVFEISPLYLRSPQGGQKILVNSDYFIRWVTGEALAEELVNIQYSTNDGLDWVDLGDTQNDGQYEWAVPAVESNQYRVRIRIAGQPDIEDWTADTFVVYRCYEQIPGDLDGDCMVGLSDLAILAQNWLNRGRVLIREFSFDENPNWSTGGQWEFGQPLGLGGESYGHPDPSAGYTGANVYGINLEGDYDPAVGGPYYLTTGPLDCRHFRTVQVAFMSWLNIDSSDYAQCQFEISTNGADWTVLWNNTPDPITDSEWQKMEFDISEFAEDNPTVYLRWGYQIIDRAYPYSGWNIDDIQLWGTL